MKIDTKKLKKRVIGFFSAITVAICSFPSPGSASELQYWPQGPEVQSSSAIVMELSTGLILYEKNINDVHYPASITKILTTLLVLENSTMDEVVTFSKDSVYNTEGSSIARDVGEEMTIEQCLYAVMLASANECAYAVAEHVAGDINSFVDMMNDRCVKLGCKNTHFNNCNGLPDEQHYTSVYDMALIAREAYANEAFRIICGTKTYTIPFTNKHKDEETFLQNHHQMLYPYRTREHLYDYCLGGKTGYTTVANSTLVTYAEKDGMALVCVVMDAPGSGHYEDTRALLDFCFDNFKKMNVSENEDTYEVKDENKSGSFNNSQPFVSLDEQGSIILPVTAEFKDANSEIIYDNADNDVLGSIQYTYSGRIVGQADIVATNAQIDQFQFHDLDSEIEGEEEVEETESIVPKNEKKVFQISPRLIISVLAGIGIILLLILIIYKIADNFYRIKRKFSMYHKIKTPYKEIKKNKIFRRRKRY
ncbi:MAG: D-alanyl-D-alanine carboxypeptidase [Roseburia sp.]|nr:D-alanyl-D-alanine carboxypeptidase [Roseburia sp.]